MNKPLAVLIVEDLESDVQLLIRLLKKADYELAFEQVKTAEQMRYALEKRAWDVVISDYNLPQLDGPAALKLLQDTGLDIPFIVISGAMGEETAVAMMKAGAHDYLIKSDLARLVPAVERELNQVGIRRGRKQAEDALRESEARYQLIFENSGTANSIFDTECRLILRNTLAGNLGMILSGDPLGKTALEIFGPEKGLVVTERMRRVLASGVSEVFETAFYPSVGKKWFRSTYQPIFDKQHKLVGIQVVSQDITGTKQSEEVLRESESLYRQAIEVAGAVPYRQIYGDSGTGVHYNFIGEGIRQITGYGPHEFSEVLWDSITEERVLLEDLAAYSFVDAVQRVRSGENPIWKCEHRIRARDGKIHWVFEAAVELRDEKGVSHGSIGLFQDITERKQAEEALRESEERFHSLYDNTMVGLYRTTPDGQILALNPAGVRLLGYDSFDEIAKRNLEETGYEPDYSRQEFRKKLEREGVLSDLENKWIKKDGSIVIRDKDGKALYYDGSFEDITGRRQVEQSLREREEQYRTLVEKIPALVYLDDINIEGRTLYISPQIEKILGYTPQEWQQNSPGLWNSSVHPDDFVRVNEEYKRCFQNGKPFEAEYRIIASNGQLHWFHDQAFLLHDENGKPRLIQGLSEDITERKQAENALRESEERFRTLYDNATIGLYRTTPGGRILMLNPAGVRMLGYASFDEIAQRDLENPEFQTDYPRKDFRERLEREGTIFGLERKMKKKDGSSILVRESSKAFRDENGKVLYYDGSFEDITERKQAQEALQISEERYRELFDSMIDGFALHEIICDEKGIPVDYRFLEVNPAFERLTGLQSADLIGRTVLEVLPKTESYWISTYGNVALTGRSAFFENFSGELGRYYEVSAYCPRPGQFAVITVDVTVRKRAEEAQSQRVVELEMLNRVSLVLRTVSKQEDMLAIVLDEALAILNTSHGYVSLWDQTTNRLHKIIMRGWSATVSEPPQKIGEGIAGKVFASGDTIISREYVSDPNMRDETRDQIPGGWGGICLPIRTTYQTLGVMFVSVPSERELDQNEIRLLTTLSEMTGASLQRMQLHDQTVRRLDQLNALRAIDQAIASSLDMRLTLNILLTHTISQLGVDAADVLLLHPASSTLEFAAGRGFYTRFPEHASVSVDNSMAGRAVREYRSIMMLDFETANQNPQFGKLWKDEGFSSYWCVLLIVKGTVKGVLEVYSRTALTPDPEWIEFLETLAGQAAIAIENTQLFENLQRANMDLGLAYDATIEGWSRAMDLRDKETEGHTKRVADMTIMLTQAMGIKDPEAVNIRRGALLHDIGKMGVPDHILLKVGELTKKEWVIMQKHPKFAYEMLLPIAYLRQALDIPYCHHEKWDGTGYPQGLKGEQIPRVARIFAIVDVWDALTSDRPYRKKWSKKKALAYIHSQSGKYFDPQVVDAFEKMIGK
jgi:PAS domain S-box-containing protein